MSRAPRQELLEALADQLVAAHGRHQPLRVAIDGVDAAGKTTLADELEAPVARRGPSVIRVSVDDFHNPREVRYRQGRQSPIGYYEDSFDLDALVRLVLEPLGPGGSRRVQRKAFDYRADQRVSTDAVSVAEDAVLLLDGIFLQRPELREHFDITIFLDVPFSETIARQVARDGAAPDVESAANRRYVEGQRLYLGRCDPRARADIVVDNQDCSSPRIVRGGCS